MFVEENKRYIKLSNVRYQILVPPANAKQQILISAEFDMNGKEQFCR